ncbi:MAG: hypothetical protein IJ804_07770 [Prevotella sp.]|nr:hypothetical protein [Prevotella sp.]
MNKTLTPEQRISIVRYRIENAENTLAEVDTHRANGFYNTAVTRTASACFG